MLVSILHTFWKGFEWEIRFEWEILSISINLPAVVVGSSPVSKTKMR